MEQKYRDAIPARYTDEEAEQILRDVFTMVDITLKINLKEGPYAE